MELLIAILSNEAARDKIKLNVDFDTTLSSIASDICFQTLVKIHDILDSDMSDFECIEEIVCALEDINWNGGSRHDF